jgi:hypothetical protein
MGTLLTTTCFEPRETIFECNAPEQQTDQRTRGRYPIALELQYKVLRGGRVEQTGTGRTRNISSGGVLFETDEQLPRRGRVELAMQWPFLLQGVCGLKLVMRGKIVRSGEDSRVTAVQAEFREFRTAGVRRTKEAETNAAVSAGSQLVS